MLWLSSPDQSAAALPTVWLVATDHRPATLAERSALRRGLARTILATQFNLEPDAVRIEHEPGGRPVIAAPFGSGLHISLATRAGLVALALAHGPVGVDVEQVDLTAQPPLAALHPTEQAMLQALQPPARPLAFAQLWSAKEAYVKALGTGFRRPPESFEVRLIGLGGFAVEDPERPGEPVLGSSRIIKNGGHETMAAAFIQLA
ncbi:4'-phosphopantetheinyl transferase family protein [Bosea rubneri]|uniref:4'-phosphopantetheinyl transferase superfamily protein n=1 Tax=Bosea rubneri TaxID=3075434 RepID=A0ABU3S7G2_9HYPH|nr:4'-phosphopantetheinyl transferase superfamily protein [Bosea sp. ZW T0_25]MDU0340720.1 4'-phosphopantetheinyl transferase superfamily protein [Bosea sp. ZW T0_25]